MQKIGCVHGVSRVREWLGGAPGFFIVGSGEDGVYETLLRQKPGNAKVGGERIRGEVRVCGKEFARLGAWGEQLSGKGVGFQFAAGARGIFFDAALLVAEAARVGLLAHLCVVAGGMEGQPFSAMEDEVSKLVCDGKGAPFWWEIGRKPDDAAHFRLINDTKLKPGMGAGQHDVSASVR